MLWFKAAHYAVCLGCQEGALLIRVIKSPRPFRCDECPVYPIVQTTDKGVKLPVLIPEVVRC